MFNFATFDALDIIAALWLLWFIKTARRSLEKWTMDFKLQKTTCTQQLRHNDVNLSLHLASEMRKGAFITQAARASVVILVAEIAPTTASSLLTAIAARFRPHEYS